MSRPGSAFTPVLRATVLLSVLQFAAGCSPTHWTLTVKNMQPSEDIGVRVLTGGTTSEWVVEGRIIRTLMRAPDQPSGTVELFDLQTCSLLVSKEIPSGGSTFAIASRGVTGDGRWELSTDIERPRDDPGSPTSEDRPCSTQHAP